MPLGQAYSQVRHYGGIPQCTPNIFSSVLRKSREWPRRTVGGSTPPPRGLATDPDVCWICPRMLWMRISAILDFKCPIMCSLKSHLKLLIIETTVLNCLVFEQIAFLHFGDRRTNRQTDGQAHRIKPPSLSLCRAAT